MIVYLLLASAAVLGLGVFKGGDIVDKIETELPDWNRFDALFQKYGTSYGVDWKWLKAIALNESSLGKAASVARGLAFPSDVQGSKSSDGKSWGLMQVTLTTARDLDSNATEIKLNNPEYSIMLSAKLFSKLKKTFSQLDSRYVEWVIKSYNQGPGNTKKEIAGGKGYAQEYWERFKRNLIRVEDSI